MVYINGAIAEPSVRTINKPSNNKNKTMGTSQYFLRTRINIQNSFNMEIFPATIDPIFLENNQHDRLVRVHLDSKNQVQHGYGSAFDLRLS